MVRIGSRYDGAKTAPSKIPAAARREKALELRAKGMSIRAIAGKLGVSKSQVQRDIEKELQAAAEGLVPLLVFKRNREELLAVLRWEDLLALLRHDHRWQNLAEGLMGGERP